MADIPLNNEVVANDCEKTKDETQNEPAKAAKACHENGSGKPVEESANAKEDAPTYDLNKFQLQRILNNNTRNKSIALLGRFPHVSNSDNAIVIFEKKAFREKDVATGQGNHDGQNGDTEEVRNEDDAESSYFGNDLKVQTEFINNIYGSYQCTPPSKINGVKATVVYPATDKHIEKYSICQKYIINETPELYKDITEPFITSSQFSLEWVYNILEHKKETERIIFEDTDPETGFVLLPDLKWDGRNVENLYVLVITHKRGIKSIRDLNATHLPLLRNIRNRVTETIEKRYGLVGTQLRMYFHYQPSFYHLHVHINPVRNDAPGIWCEKSHMLDTVINNLELLPDYYEKATLPFVAYEGNKLLDLYDSKMTIRKAAKRAIEQLDDVSNGSEEEKKASKAKKPKTEGDVFISESKETVAVKV